MRGRRATAGRGRSGGVDALEPRQDLHDGFQDGLEPLEALDLGRCTTIDALVRGMARTSFGGRTVGEAADALEKMVRDPECGVVLTLSGAMTMAKMGLVIVDMLDKGMVQAIVSTGALMCHGFVESAGGTHFKADDRRTDEQYYREGYNRVYDTLELEQNLDDVYEIMCQVLDPHPEAETLCSSEVNWLLGRWLRQHRPGRAILSSAWQRGVPVFVPAFTDSELGIDFSIHNRHRRRQGRPELRYDPFVDLERFVDWACAQEQMGIFTIGGGVPRNWAQEVGPYVELLASRGLPGGPESRRYKYAVRVCPEPVHWGGLSGCTYSEGVSWGKFVPKSEGGLHVEVPSDATIAWPLIVRAVLERLERQPAPQKKVQPWRAPR